jgi:hypothetical protein
MCARSRCYRSTVSYGTTTVGVSNYSPAGGSPEVVELLEMYVGGAPYGKARRNSWYSYENGVLVWRGPPGLWFAEQGGTLVITPTPSEAGLSLSGLGAVMPPDLTVGGASSQFKIDSDMQEPLVNGAAGTELLRIGEGDPASMEATFGAACDELRRRVRKRYQGSGPKQILISGVNA